MSDIQLLDSLTINQIAAGEVIERPSSVVKELAENAIDAGATAVTVEIRDGGLSLIRVTDNGSGMTEEDLPRAFLRHSTSKLRSADDLTHIASLGFRGEALASIASIAKVEVLTKKKKSLLGRSYKIEGGEELSNRETGCPDGTTFLVEDLFFNTPVRKRFMKSASAEAGEIQSLLQALAMAHPETSFRYIANGQNRFFTVGNGALKDVIYVLFGKEYARDSKEVLLEEEGLTLHAFLGSAPLARGNRSMEFFFVNGRPIKSELLQKVLEEAYQPYLMQRQFPFAILSITLPAEEVDVNVHPRKTEIRFREEALLYDRLLRLLSKSLDEQKGVRDGGLITEKAENPFRPKEKYPEPFETGRSLPPVPPADSYREMSGERESAILERLASYGGEKRTLPSVHKPLFGAKEGAGRFSGESVPRENTFSENRAPGNITHESTPPAQGIPAGDFPAKLPKAEQPSLLTEEEQKPPLRLIGQVFKTYWLIEGEDVLYMMDQHAAHEKVLYERLVHYHRSMEKCSQELLIPELMMLSQEEEETYERAKETLEALGYALEPFGDHTYRLTHIPFGLPRTEPRILLQALLSKKGTNFSPERCEEYLIELATMACKAAIKGNQNISFREAEVLLQDLMKLENPYHCPHGRPVLISFTKTDLERKFKRIVN